MKVLFDLNVLVDVAIRWRQFPDSLGLFERISGSPEHEGAFPASGYTTIYYLLNEAVTDHEARTFLQRFQRLLRVLPFDGKTAARAMALPMKDLEDACVAATAFEAGYDCIATRDATGFVASPIPARSPTRILEEL